MSTLCAMRIDTHKPMAWCGRTPEEGAIFLRFDDDVSCAECLQALQNRIRLLQQWKVVPPPLVYCQECAWQGFAADLPLHAKWCKGLDSLRADS